MTVMDMFFSFSRGDTMGFIMNDGRQLHASCLKMKDDVLYDLPVVFRQIR